MEDNIYSTETVNRMMNKKRKKNKTGLPPGALIHIGERRAEEITVEKIEFNGSFFNREILSDLQDVEISDQHVLWIDVRGLHDINKIQEVGKKFKLHPLLLEDVLNTEHPPKIDRYDDYLFMILKGLDRQENKKFYFEHIALVLGKGYLISFQEKKDSYFENILKRAEDHKGYIRDKKAEYLFYALCDYVTDHFFGLIDEMGVLAEEIEDGLLDDPEDAIPAKLLKLKKNLIRLGKIIRPFKQAVIKMTRLENDDFSNNQMYFNDLIDHLTQVTESLENYKDYLSSLMDIYFTGVSNKMNRVMKTLTIISTIFIPLTFVAGVYGMNFKRIPELSWKWGYGAVWAVFLVIVLFMVLFFKKKKWF